MSNPLLEKIFKGFNEERGALPIIDKFKENFHFPLLTIFPQIFNYSTTQSYFQDGTSSLRNKWSFIPETLCDFRFSFSDFRDSLWFSIFDLRFPRLSVIFDFLPKLSLISSCDNLLWNNIQNHLHNENISPDTMFIVHWSLFPVRQPCQGLTVHRMKILDQFIFKSVPQPSWIGLASAYLTKTWIGLASVPLTKT